MKRSGIWIISISVFLAMATSVCFASYAEALTDKHITIFSDTHDTDSQVTEKKGTLHIIIYSIHPIETVSVNGYPVEVTDDRQLHITRPYTLKENAESFRVVVETSKGTQEEVFRIRYRTEAESDWFHLLAMAKRSRIENVEKVGDGEKKESADKTVLLLVPGITLGLGKSNALEMRALLLRERYSDKKYEKDEMVYNQFAAYLHTGMAWLRKLSLGIGYNDITLRGEDSPQEEKEGAVEKFFDIDIFHPLTNSLDLEFGLRYSARDSKIDYSKKVDETVGREIASSLELSRKTSFGTFELSLGREQYEADGDNHDAATDSYGFDYSFSIGSFSPKLGVDIDRKKYQNKEKYQNRNSSSDTRQENRKTTAFVLLRYRLFENFVLSLSYHDVNRLSNREVHEYSQSIAEITTTFRW